MIRVFTDLHLVVLLSLFYLPLNGNSHSFTSIYEIIEFETGEIGNSELNDPAELSEKYLSRADSYLLVGEYDLAFSDFQTSYNLNALCQNESDPLLLFHSLFGQAIVYGCNEMLEDMEATIKILREHLDVCFCNPDLIDQKQSGLNRMAFCNKTSRFSPSEQEDSMWSVVHAKIECQEQSRVPRSVLAPSSVYICAHTTPICGPDHISIQDCMEFARGTARQCRYLISLVPKAEVQVVLNILIDDLENRAIKCCRAGGVWKACLQPIASKWRLWNQKWQVLGIPPDPAWE